MSPFQAMLLCSQVAPHRHCFAWQRFWESEAQHSISLMAISILYNVPNHFLMYMWFLMFPGNQLLEMQWQRRRVVFVQIGQCNCSSTIVGSLVQIHVYVNSPSETPHHRLKRVMCFLYCFVFLSIFVETIFFATCCILRLKYLIWVSFFAFWNQNLWFAWYLLRF